MLTIYIGYTPVLDTKITRVPALPVNSGNQASKVDAMMSLQAATYALLCAHTVPNGIKSYCETLLDCATNIAKLFGRIAKLLLRIAKLFGRIAKLFLRN